MHRLRYRTDLSQKSIVDALTAAGCLVHRCDIPGDLLVRSRNRLYLLDCGRTKGSKPRTKEQLERFTLWGVVVVQTPEEALAAVGLEC